VPPDNYDKKFAYTYVRDGERIGETRYADSLDEIASVDRETGGRVTAVEEGFFAYEKENNYRLAWRSRGPVQRRKWAAECRLARRPALRKRSDRPESSW
jgi:hypothetical protein